MLIGGGSRHDEQHSGESIEQDIILLLFLPLCSRLRSFQPVSELDFAKACATPSFFSSF